MTREFFREERCRGVLEAFASNRLAGLPPPSPAAIQDAWDYIEGRRTLDEIIHDALLRHARGDAESPATGQGLP